MIAADALNQLLYEHSEVVVFAVTLASMVIATVLGWAFARFYRREADPGSDLIQSAMLTLISLLLAFGVSMAESRYEARRMGEIDESNAISTAYLRANLLSKASANNLKRVLRAYLDERITFYQSYRGSGPSSSWRRLTDALEEQAWEVGRREMLANPTIEKSLVLTSLNETFDLYQKQTAQFAGRVPYSLIVLLYIISLMVSCLSGYLQGGHPPRRHRLAAFSLSLMIAMTLFVILDLDRPRRGLIRIPPQSLLELREQIALESGS